jgi:hypothetical protein
MNQKLLLFVSLLPVIFSCNDSTTGIKHAENVQTDSVSSMETAAKKDTVTNSNENKTLQPGSDTFTIQLHLDGINDNKTIPLTIQSGKELFAVIHKDNRRANIRINQIEMPDSTFDGPFGDSLHYKLKMPGTYQLIIAHDLMAEGKPSGVFTLKAWVK